MKETKNTLSEKTFSGFLWMFSGSGIQGISQFLVLIILARLIEPSEFGIVSAAMVVIGFSIIFSSLGVGPALVQRPILNDNHINSAFILSLLTGSFFTLSIFLMSYPISRFFNIEELDQVLKILSFTFLIQGIYTTALSLLERDLQYKTISIINASAYVFGYGFTGITLGLNGYGVYSLVAAQIVQELFKLILILRVRNHSKKIKMNINALKELMYFGSGFTIARIFNYFALQGDNLIVGRMLGADSLGIYGRVYQLMALPASLFGQVVDKVLFSAMSKLQTDEKRLKEAYKKAVVLVSMVALPISVFAYLFSKEIIFVLLGKGWGEAVLPFNILTIGIFFRTSYKISESVARSTGAVYRRAWRQAIYALSVLIGCFIGQNWGLIGIAVAVNVALVINYILMAQLSLSILSVKLLEFIKINIPAVLNGIVLFIVLSIVNIHLSNPLLTLIINFLILILVLLIVCTLFPRYFLGKEAEWIIKFVKKYFYSIRQKK
ncbi:lipopolysaccharide biosynthesis protein [Metabacillus indicus]|uniref:lipopolysaccharide biosynthesis protein n=1 Tax=Metabacillus indicus TaxID=246786 RepID=UPI002A080534|nr:lipopolysaccharide biosynthesis protein [Metabacillus indicus]MDX8289014.1 lipopolysaccharide biosynthesis protein [Metabacillus indicus]